MDNKPIRRDVLDHTVFLILLALLLLFLCAALTE